MVFLTPRILHDPDQALEHRRRLDEGVRLRPRIRRRLLEHDHQVQPQVAQEWERVPGIDCKGRQNGENLVFKVGG